MKFVLAYVDRNYTKKDFPADQMKQVELSFPGNDEKFFVSVPKISEAGASQALAERLFEIWTDGSMPMRERKERLGYFVDSQTAGDY